MLLHFVCRKVEDKLGNFVQCPGVSEADGMSDQESRRGVNLFFLSEVDTLDFLSVSISQAPYHHL